MKSDKLNEAPQRSISEVSDIDTEGIKAEKYVLNISLAGSIIFLIAEILCAVFTHSMAILMDCVYDIAQLVMIGPFLILVPLLYKPATEKRPYGYSQVESLFIMIKYLALLIIEAILVKESLITQIPASTYLCIYCNSFDKEKDYIERLLEEIRTREYRITGDYICEVVAEVPMDMQERGMFLRLQVPVSLRAKDV